jgi:hypothetical protein
MGKGVIETKMELLICIHRIMGLVSLWDGGDTRKDQTPLMYDYELGCAYKLQTGKRVREFSESS